MDKRAEARAARVAEEAAKLPDMTDEQRMTVVRLLARPSGTKSVESKTKGANGQAA
jgi:hypothetical protein